MTCVCDGESRCIEHRQGFEVINLATEESHGVYETLTEARGCARYDRLREYSIWHNDSLVEQAIA